MQENYYGNVNVTILENILPTAERILEVGCGAGALAAAIRSRFPGVQHYAGIDIESEALTLAEPFLDQAVLCDLNGISDWRTSPQLTSIFHPPGFDHILFGDVLEHLIDPDSALAQAARLLSSNGSIIACIPNVQHWSVFAQLMAGSWPKQESGIFDKTHLRWFARDDMLEMMARHDLHVEKVISRIFNPESGVEFLEYLEPLANFMNLDFDSFLNNSLPLQYVIVATKKN